MINTISLIDFKAFNETTVDFSNLTILCGVNGGGKSSIIQAILLLAQTKMALNNNKLEYINLNGYYLKYFTKKELLHVAGGDKIEIKINDEKFVLTDELQIDSRLKLENEIELDFFKNFQFISADRFGPKRYQEDTVLESTSVGKNGENAFKVLTHFYTEIGEKVENNLEKIFGEKISIQPNRISSDTHISSLGLKNYVSHDADYLNPVHMPFGISYILPIIVALETFLFSHSTEKSILIIENPEAHLHPRAQSNLGRLFTEYSSENLQIIVETHSEHIINGSLLGIKDKNMNKDNLVINFFTKGNSLGSHKINKISFNENMEIESWPDGFMDQFTNDSFKLLLVDQ